MIVANLPALQIIIALLCAPICAIINDGRFARFLACAASLISLNVSILLSIMVYHGGVLTYELGGWQPPFGIEYRIDALTCLMLVLVSFIGSVTSIFASRQLDKDIDPSKHSLFYCLYLLCFAGLLGIIITNDAFNIYVFLEISSLATYAIIAMGRDRRALLASFEYLILGTVGATFILIGVGLLYMMTGTLNISDIALRIYPVLDTTPIIAALAFLFIGLLLKIAMFPLHIWLTNAYTNAPTFVSAFLSATATKVSIYLLIRVIFAVFGYKYVLEDLDVGSLLMVLATIAIVAGAVMAIFQHNVKRMLAYSSVSQIGYILLGISLASQAGMTAAIVQLFNHAIAKAGLFMIVGCIAYHIGAERLSQFKGIGKSMPLMVVCFVICGASLIGVPLTAGFISKWYLLTALWELSLWPVMVAVLISSLLAVMYVWRVVEVMFFQCSECDGQTKHSLPLVMVVMVVLMTLLVLTLGVYSQPLTDVALNISAQLFDLLR